MAVHACGWVKQKADILLEQQLPAILFRDDFHEEMSRFTQSVIERHILQSFAPEPTESQREELSSKPFVRQLDLIELDFEDICSAISDYYRAIYDSTLWGESGEVYPTSFVELDKSLKRVWKNNRKVIFLQNIHRADTEKGQLLFFECQKHNQQIEGMEPPSHFIPGCFHLLADSKEVGWHPSYSQLLTDDISEGEK